MNEHRLTELLEGCRGREVWVVGDIMVDEYVCGTANRISPEAPVPVVRVTDSYSSVGGAANVARQVAALGANVVLGGVVGRDEEGDRLIADCQRLGIRTHAVLRDEHRTTRKLRVLGRGQQLVRLDWEVVRHCDAGFARDLNTQLHKGEPPDVMILSDYAKGVLTDTILDQLRVTAQRVGCRVLVDPKRRDFEAYRGVSVLTPNLKELSRAAGLEDIELDDHEGIVAVARSFIRTSRLGAMLVTLGERGMLLVLADGDPYYVPAMRREVSDVTGAGDTVVAVVATVLAAGAKLEEAVELANAAAGIVVAEVGTAVAELGQIKSALVGLSGHKILSRKELTARVDEWRAAGKRVVFTNGCFDLLHRGHLSLLHAARRLGDVLVVAINSDDSVRRLKGPSRPIMSAAERASLLAALSCVDVVTIFEELTPLKTLEIVRPHVLVKGKDYQLHGVTGREFVESCGGRVELLPFVDDCSTSSIVDRIKQSVGKD